MIGDVEVGLSVDGKLYNYRYVSDGEEICMRADVDENGVYTMENSDGTPVENFNPNEDLQSVGN